MLGVCFASYSVGNLLLDSFDKSRAQQVQCSFLGFVIVVAFALISAVIHIWVEDMRK